MKNMLITGATGFIGHYLVKEFVNDYRITCLIRPGSKNLERLADVYHYVKFVQHDIRTDYNSKLKDLEDIDVILHAGGNPGSTDSIENPVGVVIDNVVGTTHLLELARTVGVDRFVYYGAGEVFGPIAQGTDSKEDDPYNTVSPYAASKIGGEELCVAYAHTYGVPVSITHLTNTFGPRSQPNRFPVIAIRKILNNEPLTLYTGPDGSISGRRWFHAADVASQTRFILENQTVICEKWNSAGPKYITNLEMAEMIAIELGKELNYQLEPISRAGHNPYFSITPDKLYSRGWMPMLSTEARLKDTINWYKENQQWLV